VPCSIGCVTLADRARASCGCGCAVELAGVRAELAALRTQVERLTAAVGGQPVARAVAAVSAAGVRDLAGQRVALFRSLFVGREDVYAQRRDKDGRAVWYPQLDRLAGQSWQEARDARRYRPLTDAVLRDHLSGRVSVGLYPMLTDDTCRLLVCDFDAEQWQLDAQAYARAADGAGVAAVVEVSRSGQGARHLVSTCRAR
jgi:hypothetical protein